MKKILICLLTCLLATQLGVKNLKANEITIYTPEDFVYDKVYNFKTGDKIVFGDDVEFDLYKYGTSEVLYENITEYVFDSDYNARIKGYSLGNYKYVDLYETYIITFDLKNRGNNFSDYAKYYWFSSEEVGRFYAFLPAVPTANNLMFEYWCIDEELEKPIYYNDDTKERYWDIDGEYEITEDTTFYAKWAQVELQCIEVKGPSETNPDQDIELQILPIANNERIYDVSNFEESARPVICVKVDGVEAGEILYDETKDGYFYNLDSSSSEKEYQINFYIKNNTSINTDYVVESYNVNSNETLLNDGWPWGSNFSISCPKYSVQLNTDISSKEGISNLTYQWQTSGDNANYEDIATATENSHIVEIEDYSTFDNCWFRCVVTYTKDGQNYKCVSKAIKIMDSRELNQNIGVQYGSLFNEYAGRNINGTLEGLYISNDLGAYSIGSNGKNQYFNVLGKYNNGQRNYWTSASYDAAWALYFKDGDTFVSEDNIRSIVCNFEDGTSNVNFDITLKNKADVALYTDLCIGRFPEIYFADGAAYKANLDENNKLESIHLVANGDFGSANLEDNIGFAFKPQTPADAYNIDALINGPYEDDKMGRFQYISNDYNNEESLTYEQIYNALKSRLYDYNHGIVSRTFSGNDPFVYRTINGEKVVVAMYGKDSVMSCAWNNTDNIKFSMNIGNAIDLGINNTDVENIEPEPPAPRPNIDFIIPKTGIN